MVLLPTPLKAFTDSMSDIKAMLRICARNLYDWQCDHASMSAVNSALDRWTDWTAYPKSWPRSPGERRPLGIVDLTPGIEKSAANRLAVTISLLADQRDCLGVFVRGRSDEINAAI
jgi:hypothetical protein